MKRRSTVDETFRETCLDCEFHMLVHRLDARVHRKEEVLWHGTRIARVLDHLAVIKLQA